MVVQKKKKIFVFFKIVFRYWNSFVQTDMFCKYQVDVLTSGQVTLGDVLFCDGLLSYFMEVRWFNIGN